jgi:hypothetical protein
MRTIEFERNENVTSFYTIEILDEDLFKTEFFKWFQKFDEISVWDLENEHFSSVNIIERDEKDSFNDDYDLSETILDEILYRKKVITKYVN